MKLKAISALCIALTTLSTVAQTHKKLPYLNPALSIERRVEDLLKRMTLGEKIAQLNLRPYYVSQDSSVRAAIRAGRIGALLKANGVALNLSLQREAIESSRLGIPLIFHEDVIHGYRTITPIPLAESCSWDRVLVGQSAALAAREAASAGIQLTYAPMVDISNDPRWGRIMETSGEDAFLCSQMAIARVKGFQGESGYTNETIMACVKHFAGYGALLAGRDYLGADFSLRDLQERYLPPFQAAIDAGAGSVMCSYLAYNGEPVTMSRFMNTDILRGQMGFTGLLMTDWCTLTHAVSMGAVADGRQSALRGMLSGMEMDMSSSQYITYLEELVREKKVSEKLIDKAVANALRVKFELGLFDDPYKYFDLAREQRTLLSAESRQIARQMAISSMVLLKNNARTLPLAKERSIALVGPFASAKGHLMGSWTMMGRAEEVESVSEGFQAIKKDVLVADCPISSIGEDQIKAILDVVSVSDVAVVCLGEDANLIGEAVSTAKIEIPAAQIKLLKAVRAKAKRVVVVLFNGRPLVLDQILANCDALLEAWYPGTMGGSAVAQLIMGESVPSGKLTQTFPRHSGQIPLAYNFRRTFSRVNHADLNHGPQFPFGYGLSYTDFEYGDPTVSADSLPIGQGVHVRIKIRNAGGYKAREVVQLYIRDEVATIIPREKELKAFEIIELEPGQEKEVLFDLDSESFAMFDSRIKRVIEPGIFKIMVGTNSADVKSVDFKYY